MTCFICKKSYSRINQHLRKKHKITNICTEPQSLMEFAKMLTVMPTMKNISTFQQELVNFVDGQKDLTKEQYSNLEHLFKKYKMQKGIKVKLCVAQYKMIKRRMKSNKEVNSKNVDNLVINNVEIPSENIQTNDDNSKTNNVENAHN